MGFGGGAAMGGVESGLAGWVRSARRSDRSDRVAGGWPGATFFLTRFVFSCSLSFAGGYNATLLLVCDNCQIKELRIVGTGCVASLQIESVDGLPPTQTLHGSMPQES